MRSSEIVEHIDVLPANLAKFSKIWKKNFWKKNSAKKISFFFKKKSRQSHRTDSAQYFWESCLEMFHMKNTWSIFQGAQLERVYHFFLNGVPFSWFFSFFCGIFLMDSNSAWTFPIWYQVSMKKNTSSFRRAFPVPFFWFFGSFWKNGYIPNLKKRG